ncbi:DUF826 domain-containing protein [Escherichia coli]|uniref:DUF826 domain-containing protein n=1 Tax=Escherichia coli TaxID=562 RepID=UPI0022E0072B|nr:DUF826 domain-containing protein [Escherichia coli]
MSEIKSLVTAEAVKEVLRSEEVRSALKQQLRQNLEARLDAEVDSILDELLGAQPEPSPELLPEPQAEDVTTENGDIQPESPVTDMTDTHRRGRAISKELVAFFILVSSVCRR